MMTVTSMKSLKESWKWWTLCPLLKLGSIEWYQKMKNLQKLITHNLMIVPFRFHITLNWSGLKSTNCTRNIRKSLIHPEKNQIINKQKEENKFNLSIQFLLFNFAITNYSISHATNRRHSMRQYEGSQHIKNLHQTRHQHSWNPFIYAEPL